MENPQFPDAIQVYRVTRSLIGIHKRGTGDVIVGKSIWGRLRFQETRRLLTKSGFEGVPEAICSSRPQREMTSRESEPPMPITAACDH
jgi:hypothetical protein